uniref:Uncharacterized protein n=1 Tax=Chromera velia CCMP2878 TaxID=1169474 RepID=A0A0G4HFK9_9ALVE|eukprot:Cvel_27075.t1-p1 / transcript=Cvel_27075.t1 / gene=Cvel_27075 / organism=Chromera_velia_CCMP2878 / gene_product=hypothetical protein / transcript_product=hypothetical protein / location=Cvel_scaffold3315:1871-3065(+) / protein_length=297 / sequence_SO=supercontig / SO=protein_coding / is_pseudo=false
MRALAKKRLFWLFRYVFSGDMSLRRRLAVVLVDSVTVAAIIYFFSYELITSGLLDTIACEAFEDGMALRLTERRSILCSSDDYNAFLGMALAFMVAYTVALPGILALVIARQRSQLMTVVQAFFRNFSLFFGGYTSQYFFWEIVILARKFTGEFAVAFNRTTDPRSRLLPLLCHAALFAFLQLRCQPYRKVDGDILNRLETWSLVIWLFTLILFAGVSWNELSATGVLLTYGIIAVCFVGFVCWGGWVVVIGFLLETHKKYRNLRNEDFKEWTWDDWVIAVLRLDWVSQSVSESVSQ